MRISTEANWPDRCLNKHGHVYRHTHLRELCEGEHERGRGGGSEGQGGKTRLSISLEAKLDPDSLQFGLQHSWKCILVVWIG